MARPSRARTPRERPARSRTVAAPDGCLRTLDCSRQRVTRTPSRTARQERRGAADLAQRDLRPLVPTLLTVARPVFLSYSWDDTAEVDELDTLLRLRGVP